MRPLLLGLFAIILTACVDRSVNPVVPEALDVGEPYTVFVASSRAKEADGTYGFRRSDRLSLLELTVSIPPAHQPGDLSFSYANPDPEQQFTLAGQREFATQRDFNARVSQRMRSFDANNREVVIFVHGYNTTQVETAFRAAQMAHDVEIPGQIMMYSWPSRGRAYGYAYDLDSMLFARDGLESFVNQVKAAGAKRVILVAHSMGSALTMEMLRQAELKNPGWASRTFEGVILISPDLDIDLFREQMDEISDVPQPFAIMVSEKDKALGFSARLRGTADSERLGNISSIQKIADLPVEVIDTTAFNEDAASSHFVAATSPSLLAMFKATRPLSQALETENSGIESLFPATLRNSSGATSVTLTAPPSGEDR
ncbi:alpha/beta fold hydrolase [Ruegeria sp. 2205SS24-7]|uniref:alpha/beta hydrolase n=1 Tax=Ruegeria discodermiae TaxID=3064389 RepID=UPI002740329D|nr:alpha/beta fold hydrolase [Ruegeria sp. 2205SS24-7]MDP5219475.1 alpha/beta fold hydrolase [Ruegeria sp. 2205SS24-7]